MTIIQSMSAGRPAEPASDHYLARKAGSSHVISERGIAEALNLFGFLKVLL